MAETARFKVELEDDVSDAADDAADSVDGLEQSLLGGVTAGTLLGGVFTQIGAAALQMGKAALQALLQVAVAIGRAGVEAAMFRESASMALAAVTGKDGAQQFEKMAALAREMGAPLQDVVTGFRELRMKGFGEEQATRLMKRFQDLKALGADAQGIQRVILAISQIKGAGVLQGDELNQLSDFVNKDRVIANIAKNLGKTTDEVRKMQQSGKIAADVAIAGIEAAMAEQAGGKAAGELGKKFANETLRGLIDQIGNQGAFLADELGKAFGPALDALKPILRDILNLSQGQDASAIIGQIGASVSALARAAMQAWPVIKAFVDAFTRTLAKGGASKALEAIGRVFSRMLGDPKNVQNIAVIADFLGTQLALAAQSAAVAIQALGLAVSLTMAPFETMKAIVNSVGADLLGVKGAADQVIAAVQGFIAQFAGVQSLATSGGTGIGSSLVQGFVQGIFGGQSSVISAVTSMANSAIAAGKAALGIASPSRVFATMGEFSGEGYAGGVQASVPMVQGSVESMADSAVAGAAGGGMGGAAGGAGSGIVINAPVTVTVGAAAPGATPQQIGEAVVAAQARALVPALEQLLLQGA